jgi:hypothetical protein
MESSKAVKDFGNELKEAAEKERVYNQAIVNAALGAVDTTKLTEE